MLLKEECLVSVVGKYRFADTDTTTHIAKIVSKNSQDYKVILTTDFSGESLVDNDQIITISSDNIVSNRPITQITPSRFYQISKNLIATGFATKGDTLESTSRIALGSGIQGIYMKDESLLPLFVRPDDLIFLIECKQSYSVQDAEHDDSITLASINTNRYLDRIIESIQDDQEDILKLIKINESTNLLTLWNIALYRTGDSMTKDDLDNILAKYLEQYLSSRDPLQELPINSVMKFLGYSCLITTNNRLLRKCVSYSYEDDIPRMAGKLE